MKERPILFNAEMVRAILDGRRTQTRRVITKPDIVLETEHRIISIQEALNNHPDYARILTCPFGIPGDRLWVRETWAHALDIGYSTDDFHYRATYTNGGPYDDVTKWRSPIHMPRWASRITLEITGVRVERLKDITDDGAKSEGCKPTIVKIGATPWSTPDEFESYVQSFAVLWDSIHAKRGYPWSSNPCVWVIEFKRVMEADA